MQENFGCCQKVLIHWKESVCGTIDYWSVAVLLSSSMWSLGWAHRSQVCGGWWRWGIKTDSSNANVPRGADWHRAVGFQVLVCSNAPKLLSEDKLNIHQKCAILEIVSGSLKLSVLHALDSGSLEENDGILSQWEFLSSWSLPGVCLHNK